MTGEKLKSMTKCMLEVTDILRDITGTQNLERTLHNIVRNLQENLGCRTYVIVRLNPKTEKLEILNSAGISWQFTKEFRHRDDILLKNFMQLLFTVIVHYICSS